MYARVQAHKFIRAKVPWLSHKSTTKQEIISEKRVKNLEVPSLLIATSINSLHIGVMEKVGKKRRQ